MAHRTVHAPRGHSVPETDEPHDDEAAARLRHAISVVQRDLNPIGFAIELRAAYDGGALWCAAGAEHEVAPVGELTKGT